MLTRWDPFREMLSMRQNLDRLVDSALGSQGWAPTVEYDWSLPLDVSEDADQYVIKASLPGMNPDDLDITYANNLLTIKGEIKEETESGEGKYHLRERRYGVFVRSLTLPSRINYDKAQATYERGVLTLRLPKSEELKPKKITVQSTDKLIEGKIK